MESPAALSVASLVSLIIEALTRALAAWIQAGKTLPDEVRAAHGRENADPKAAAGSKRRWRLFGRCAGMFPFAPNFQDMRFRFGAPRDAGGEPPFAQFSAHAGATGADGGGGHAVLANARPRHIGPRAVGPEFPDDSSADAAPERADPIHRPENPFVDRRVKRGVVTAAPAMRAPAGKSGVAAAKSQKFFPNPLSAGIRTP